MTLEVRQMKKAVLSKHFIQRWTHFFYQILSMPCVCQSPQYGQQTCINYCIFLLPIHFTVYDIHKRWGNKESELMLLLMFVNFDDEEEGGELIYRPPSTVTQSFIHARRLIWPWLVLQVGRVYELRRSYADCWSRTLKMIYIYSKT